MEFQINRQKICVKKGKPSTSYLLGYNGAKIIVHNNNIHIEDSYKIDKKQDILDILDYILHTCECKVVECRTEESLFNEWVAHNNLYKLHIQRERTGSVDLDYPQEKKYTIAYWLLSRIRL